MPEASSDAAILIAISWQALNRAIRNNKETLVCDCTVVILFAAFFMEANLNHIIAKLNKSEEVKKFFKNNHPGLQDKLGWFYNEFIEKSQVENSRQLYDKGIVKKIRERFPGFEKNPSVSK